MSLTWVVVAHRCGARILERRGVRAELRQIATMSYPEGRLRNRDIDADKRGQSYYSASSGFRHSLDSEQAPRERKLESFLKELSEFLSSGQQRGLYDHLVLIAEPHVLGRLKGALNDQCLRRITVTIAKDLARATERELVDYLRPYLVFEEDLPRIPRAGNIS